MPIEALALLHLDTLPAMPSVQVDRLDDASIVHTGASFTAEPEALLEALIALVGADALADHDDPRGILFIPHVAAPSARSYEAVVTEVGEGGVWAALGAEQEPADFGDFGALLGSVFAELPPSLMSAATAFAQGGPQGGGSLEAMAAQVQALLGSSPALQSLVGELQRDPSKLQQLTESMFGPQGGDTDDEKKP
ncbi:MAG: hypothetical protein JWN04_6658 [Myxococcaceae bacterium]|nr:hypothetical protein [Myxococcaceae bacterium]